MTPSRCAAEEVMEDPREQPDPREEHVCKGRDDDSQHDAPGKRRRGRERKQKAQRGRQDREHSEGNTDVHDCA